MRFAVLTALAAVPGVATSTQECPAELVLNIEALSKQEQATAQRYARCMSVPYLPISGKFAEKLAACREDRLANSAGELKDALDWVDHIASQFPGCETRLGIKKK